METATVNLYNYSELSEEAQEKVLNNLYDINTDYEWWDHISDELVKQDLKLVEFCLHYNTIKIESTCYLEDTANTILKNHGDTCETYKLAKQFLKDKDEKEFLHALEQEYLSLLNSEYEFLTSKEAIIETIECNEYQFTEAGNFPNF